MDETTLRTGGSRAATAADAGSEPHMRDLLKQLAGDGGDLLRNEMALAKLEMRDMARQVALDSARLAAALALAMTGGLALLAAIIIGLGNLLGGAYGWSALIVGALTLAVGGILARTGITGLRETSPRPEQTVRSLQRDREFAARELRQFKEEIRS